MIVDKKTGLPTCDEVNWDYICEICGNDWGNNHSAHTGECFAKNGLHGAGTYWKHPFFPPIADLKELDKQVKDLTWSYTKNNKPLSRECPCGIARVDCDYHK